MATDIIARGLAIGADAKADLANTRLDNLPKGIVYKGAVNYYNELPITAKLGDTYTVRYKGESGTEPDGSEWTCSNESPIEWVELGPELATVARTGNYNDLINKLQAGTGIIINDNVITYDEVEVSSVQYVDDNITDTMNFIIQERDTERAARIAGDDLINARVDSKQDILTAGNGIEITSDNTIQTTTFVGTQFEYEELTPEEQENYLVAIVDPPAEVEPVVLNDILKDGDTEPLTIDMGEEETNNFLDEVIGG